MNFFSHCSLLYFFKNPRPVQCNQHLLNILILHFPLSFSYLIRYFPLLKIMRTMIPENQFEEELNLGNKQIRNQPATTFRRLVRLKIKDPLNHIYLLKQKEQAAIREPCPVVSRAPKEVFQRKRYCRESSQKRK
jgi:hypothetical protein